jgi:hypothetical protein
VSTVFFIFARFLLRSQVGLVSQLFLVQHYVAFTNLSVKLLKKDRNSSPESMNRLPQMAKHLEVSLYRNARSFEAYTDMSTLKQRLQQIAVEVSRRARTPNDAAAADRGRGDRSMSYSQHPQLPPPQQPNGMRGGSTSPYMQRENNGGQRMAMEEINPMSNSAGGGHGGYQPQQRSMSQQQPPQLQPNAQSQIQNRNNDPEWKQRIRHKQQRLLLLHHSAKCNMKGQCNVTPHCVDMKRLWRHMEGCKDNNCRIAHCFSSRAILSHYRKCKDHECPACGPVRETVKKSQMSSRGGNPSTGPLMNSMRVSLPAPQIQPPHQPLSQQPMVSQMPSDGISSMGGGSFASNHSMPPPGVPGNGEMQYSSNQYRPGNAGPGSLGAVQPLYRSDQQSSNSRVPTPTTNAQNNKDSLSVASLPHAKRPAGSSESEWQKIRHKQQRLLLLRHASRCQHDAGTCPVTPHCSSMKKLWEHIAHCKNQQCKVQHCLSSRYVLSHFRRCTNAKCPSCGPVRDSIKRSTDRERTRQDPPQRGQQFDTYDGAGLQGPSSEESMVPAISSSQVQESYQPTAKRVRMGDAPSVASAVTAPISNQSAGKEPLVQSSINLEGAKDGLKAQNGDHSMLNSFTLKELETHLASLDRKTQLPPAKLKAKCLELLKGMQTHQHGWVFNCPVDPVELGLPDYYDIIKKPMDLGSVQKRLDAGGYHELEKFEGDVHLTFDNAMAYNEIGTVVYGMAKELKTKFESDMKKLMIQLGEEDMERRQNERACTLCGCEKLLFEPPVYFCNGMNCQSQRIRRNSHFYIGGNNQYFWCSPCFNELDEKIPIELVDLTIMKGDLKKKKNDEVHEESWVQCDTCERWVHQICGLFNTRQNKEHHSEYCCPGCLHKKRKKNGDFASSKPPGAADLPRTALSEWLEQHLAKRIDRKKRSLAEDMAENEVSRDIVLVGMLVIFAATILLLRPLTLCFLQSEYFSRRGDQASRDGWPDYNPSSDFDGAQA